MIHTYLINQWAKNGWHKTDSYKSIISIGFQDWQHPYFIILGVGIGLIFWKKGEGAIN